VGSGPSGFYATEALFKSGKNVFVDMYERLPVPYGLVRHGVAPDHPKLKQATQFYDKIARAPNHRFVGNVCVGRDLTVTELREAYHAIIFTCGAEADRKLGIPGEDLTGSHTAMEFAGWYNGHPDYCDHHFDLSREVAVIIGQGNVAADVCRILAKTVDELKNTDIAQHALEALAESRVREIHIIGRRGPAQARFSNKELLELGELANADVIVAPEALELNPESETELADRNNVTSMRNVEIFQSFAGRSATIKRRRCHFHFLKSPVELRGRQRLESVVLERNKLEGSPFNQAARGTGEKMELPCGLLFCSIGHKGVPVSGVSFDERKGVFANEEGRLRDGNGTVPGLYCAGWIKRGPTGVIATNRGDSAATVNALLADLALLDSGEDRKGMDAICPLLAKRGIKHVSFEDWLKIDAAEVRRGESRGKPREKFTRVREMLKAIDS